MTVSLASLTPSPRKPGRRLRRGALTLAVTASLVGMAFYAHKKTAQAEREHPAT